VNEFWQDHEEEHEDDHADQPRRRWVGSVLVIALSALVIAACTTDVEVTVECPRTCVETGDIAQPSTGQAPKPPVEVQR
jgi:hypothetical protein